MDAPVPPQLSVPKTAPPPIRRVLIYRLGSLGDTLVALPALKLIARAFPEAERVVVTNSPPANGVSMATVLEGSGLAHRFIEYRTGERSPRALWRLGSALSRVQAEVLIYLTEPRGAWSTWRDLAFFRLCGIRRIVGAPLTAALRHPHLPNNAKIWESEASRLARCVAELGDARLQHADAWTLSLSTSERAEAERILAHWLTPPLSRFIVVAPGIRQVAKDWGEDNWTMLIRRIESTWPDCGLMLVGGDGDRARGQRLAQACCNPVLDRCGADLRITMALIARASLLIGTDGGPMHVAAALGVPSVIVFAGTDRPGVWFPAGDNHTLLYASPSVSVSVSVSISVDTVFDACRMRLCG